MTSDEDRDEARASASPSRNGISLVRSAGNVKPKPVKFRKTAEPEPWTLHAYRWDLGPRTPPRATAYCGWAWVSTATRHENLAEFLRAARHGNCGQDRIIGEGNSPTLLDHSTGVATCSWHAGFMELTDLATPIVVGPRDELDLPGSGEKSSLPTTLVITTTAKSTMLKCGPYGDQYAFVKGTHEFVVAGDGRNTWWIPADTGNSLSKKQPRGRSRNMNPLLAVVGEPHAYQQQTPEVSEEPEGGHPFVLLNPLVRGRMRNARRRNQNP